jgi:uncharacterized protein (TIRG00374 family)
LLRSPTTTRKARVPGIDQPSESALLVRRVVYAMMLAVVVYGAFAVWHGVGNLGDELSRFHAWTFAAACALALANYGMRWLKWEFYLARLGIRGVGRVDSLLTFLSGFVLTVTPGKVGEVFKSVVLFETHRVPIPRTAPIVVAERVTDLLGIVILIVVGSTGLAGGLLWAGLGVVAVALVLGVVASRRLSLGLIGVVEKLPGVFRRIGPRLHEAYESLATTIHPKNLLVPTLVSIGAWALECAALWVILLGLGAPTSLRLATFFYATSTLAGALVPVPGGLGVTETSLEGQMHRIGHVTTAASTAAMILVRLATLWLAVVVGFVALSILRKRHPGLLSGRESEALPVATPDAAVLDR